MVNQNKKTQVDSLASVLEKNSNFILLKIDGTTHKNLEKLRRELQKAPRLRLGQKQPLKK